VRTLLKHSGLAIVAGLAVGLAGSLLVPLGPASAATGSSVAAPTAAVGTDPR
jgi:hypothetical protein